MAGQMVTETQGQGTGLQQHSLMMTDQSHNLGPRGGCRTVATLLGNGPLKMCVGTLGAGCRAAAGWLLMTGQSPVLGPRGRVQSSGIAAQVMTGQSYNLGPSGRVQSSGTAPFTAGQSCNWILGVEHKQSSHGPGCGMVEP